MLYKCRFFILSSGEVVAIYIMNNAVLLWKLCMGCPCPGVGTGACKGPLWRNGWGCPCRTQLLPAGSTAGQRWSALLMFCCSPFSMEEPSTAEPCVTPILHDPETPSAEQLSSALSFCQIKEVASGWVEGNSSARFRPHPSYYWSYDAVRKPLVHPWGTEAQWDHISMS